MYTGAGLMRHIKLAWSFHGCVEFRIKVKRIFLEGDRRKEEVLQQGHQHSLDVVKVALQPGIKEMEAADLDIEYSAGNHCLCVLGSPEVAESFCSCLVMYCVCFCLLVV